MARWPGIHADPTAVLSMPGSRALFLDRDGVINADHGYVCKAEETLWVDGIFDLCRGAQALGYRIVVVTNQAGLARGYYTEEQFLGYTDWVHAQFAESGIAISATIYCPHHPSAGSGALTVACNCRKPAPGMLWEARRVLGIDLSVSAMVGDKISDMEAGRAAGVPRLYAFAGAAAEVPSYAVAVRKLVDVLDDLRAQT